MAAHNFLQNLILPDMLLYSHPKVPSVAFLLPMICSPSLGHAASLFAS
jgi:hypothetical protein